MLNEAELGDEFIARGSIRKPGKFKAMRAVSPEFLAGSGTFVGSMWKSFGSFS